MPRVWLVIAAILAGIGVVIGAMGAHLIEPRLKEWFDDAPRRLEIWKTATQYMMIHAVGLLAVGIHLRERPRWLTAVAMLFCAGMILFSGSLIVLSVTPWRFMGMIAPLGGASFIIGWFVAAWGICGSREPPR